MTMMNNHSSPPRRQQVLHAVQVAAGPIGVAELAEALSIHPNTVRFHLDTLEDAGEIERADAESVGRGRPRIRYRLAQGSQRGERRYELLAGILASGLARETRGRARAAEAGYSWGFEYAKNTTPSGQSEIGDLLGLLGEVGFAPRRADTDTDLSTVELLNCPFREAVTDHGELICGIHAGLMRGALAGWGSTVELAELEPFAAPGICRARLVNAEAA